MASSVVIKVKYEDTLRRFNVPVNGDQRLDINMEGLRLKIFSLFNMPSSANFSLTYQDEDGDLVTLVEDEDLYDVVRQGLNPVRITVSLKTDKAAQPSATFSESSTPRESSSPSLQQTVNPNVAEFLKSVPEPLRDTFAKISTMLTSKAASTSPILADLVDGFSKTGQQYLNVSPSDCGTSNVSSQAEGDKQNSQSRQVDVSTSEGVKHTDTKTSSSVKQSPKSTPQDTREAEPIPLPPACAYTVKGKNAASEPSSHKLTTAEGKKKNKEAIETSARKLSAGVHTINFSKGSVKKRVSSEKETSKSNVGGTRSFQLGGSSFKPVGECPFSGVTMPTGSMTWRDQDNFVDQIGQNPYLFNESYNKVDAMGTIFHKGVRCDGCGILPIIGPRFKSKVKHDYDLCHICFGRMGNDADYSRFDFPVHSRHPMAFKSFYDPGFKGLRVPFPPVPPVLPSWMKLPTGKHHRSRLDSRFITDVNVMDGTMMSPSTPFTKIWRMRNNGSLPWHHGLQLVWIGGDRFSASDSARIELPVDGVNVGKEIDIAVDFIAPELPGRYISYWRMAEPSGHKFGQRVWVLIQVDPSVDLTNEGTSGLDLNLPPETTGALPPQGLDVKVEPALNSEEDVRVPSMVEQEPNVVVEQKSNVEIEDLNFPINNDLLITSDDGLFPTSAVASSSASPAIVAADTSLLPEESLLSNPDVAANDNHESPPSAPPAALYPIIDMSEGFSSNTSTAKNDENNLERDNNEKNNVEECLLKELEEMGFKQIDLNKEVLRVNEYDLERSVDELCGVSEWDPMLEELKEMGFEDKEINKKLLAKNNGSITRVVMDLISGEQ
ncbi:hypothetical protein SOVF_069950 [Spinacia oleracea]|uniref:Protein JOKA2 n=1 Tax=Spinacia oleracea TaxID=3562 RepID=A0A9R0JHL4_SPIOL|nr:protein JOKA2 [Spinacia oleracea]KNA18528.1 hypothetical protein SOVF_069950 [Spinacia oleracea]